MSNTPVEDKATDIEGAIDKQIEESNALARKYLVEQLEDVMMNASVVLIKSPSDGSISLKTVSGATVMLSSVGNDAKLEVTIAYNKKLTI